MSTRSGFAAGAVAVFLGAAASTSRAAVTVEEVWARLEANAAALQRMECVADSVILNRGAHGRLLQRVEQRQSFRCDKTTGVVHERTEGASPRERWWDGSRKRWRQVEAGGVPEAEFPPTIEQVEDVWPSPNYAFFPSLLTRSLTWAVTGQTGGLVTLVGRNGGAAGGQRTEIDVGVKRGVLRQVRVYDEEGRLLERVRFSRYVLVEGVWLPVHIRERRNRQRNVVDVTLRYTYRSVNGAVPVRWGAP